MMNMSPGGVRITNGSERSVRCASGRREGGSYATPIVPRVAAFLYATLHSIYDGSVVKTSSSLSPLQYKIHHFLSPSCLRLYRVGTPQHDSMNKPLTIYCKKKAYS
jgi:hypothetical protein